MFMLAWSPFDPMHLLVIGIVALLLFGKRLPEVGRSLGRGISEFKKGLRDVQDELSKDDSDKKDPPQLRPPSQAEPRQEDRVGANQEKQ
ncbi:MAG: twin-arginine translocase TatA/TatE family subunit [Phycisphaerae bacterium]